MKYFVGLDLGQSHDPSAIAVLEADDGLVLRYLKRAPLGTPYPELVEWVRDIVTSEKLQGRCGLVVDGTGVGEVSDVNMTGGDRESDRGSELNAPRCNVPKRDLIAGLQVGLASKLLRISARLPDAEALMGELMDMKVTQREQGRVRMGADRFGQHDDMVIALALAVWRSKRAGVKKINFGGGRILCM
ncbi:MAG: hypothetical protein QOJ99_871 [Bryobacterales bacterium]|nr:hypothetical protein [Bryobacterales bacterium]